MTGDIEAVGDMATGALAAHAVEPAHGSCTPGSRAHAHGICLNCSTALIGPHCHECGQSGHVHRSLAAIWHDLAHGVFHFEGRIFRTLPMLAWHPGALTRRYIAGERARFVSPMALFLFSVFLMFAVINSVGGGLHTPELDAAQRKQAGIELARRISEADKAITDNRAAREAATKAGRDTQALDIRHGELIKARQGLDATLNRLEKEKDDSFTFADIDTGWAKLDKGIAKANANPNLALYKIQSSAYKFSWALIPISVPFLWLLFLWRRGYHVYDHAIFITYSLAFMTLLTIALTLAGLAGLPTGMITMMALIIPPVHMYRQLRGAYSLRRFSALWRTVMLAIFCAVAALLFVLLLLGMGLLG